MKGIIGYRIWGTIGATSFGDIWRDVFTGEATRE
jgi:hypothetical protein